MSTSPLDLRVDYFKEDPRLEMCKHTLCANDHALVLCVPLLTDIFYYLIRPGSDLFTM